MKPHEAIERQRAFLDGVFCHLPKEKPCYYFRSHLAYPWVTHRLLAWDFGVAIRMDWQKVQVKTAKGEKRFRLDEFLSHFPRISKKIINHVGVSGTSPPWVGALSCELGVLLETKESRHGQASKPLGLLYLPTRVIWEMERHYLLETWDFPPFQSSPPPFQASQRSLFTLSPSFEKYEKDLKTLLLAIHQGDIYQANYTLRITLPCPKEDLKKLFLRLTSVYGAPLSAFLQGEDGFILSWSPELFLSFQDGKVITRPIKGTLPRGGTPQQDRHLKKKLMASQKDQTELAMIVDLLRNDLNRSCLPGTVRVLEHAKVESYPSVHHLVSTIQGEIPQSLEAAWRTLLRCLPGGSISGCPKAKALKILESLEEEPRGFYTGHLGYLDACGRGIWNVANRTAQGDQEAFVLGSGGGIVADSQVDEEYQEALVKVRSLVENLGYTFMGHLVWQNDTLIPQKASLLPPDPFSLHQGCFETILVKEGKPQNWRLQKGMDYWHIGVKPPRRGDMERLCRLNVCQEGKLNIYAFVKEAQEVVVASCSLLPAYPEAINLWVDDQPFFPPKEVCLQGIKTLRYQAYQKATQRALTQGCWDTILWDAQGNLLETSRANLYVKIQGTWWTPVFPVIQGTVRKTLLQSGKARESKLPLSCLKDAEAVGVSNALIGFRKVRKIIFPSGKTLSFPS